MTINEKSSFMLRVGEYTGADIPDLIIKAATEGTVVRMQGTRPIFEIIFNGTLKRFAITIGNNGYIVGANPRSLF